MYTVSQLNAMSQEAFTDALREIWEDTPEITRRVWVYRPFKDVNELHLCMVRVVEEMSDSEQLALIKAHPALGSKAKMAEASVREQTGAGLDRLDTAEYKRFQELNQAYKDKFGMPFIIAVKNHTKASILKAFETRLGNAIVQEKQQALQEISKIAHFRLEATVQVSA